MTSDEMAELKAQLETRAVEPRLVRALLAENERLQYAARTAVLTGLSYRDDADRTEEWFTSELNRIQGLIEGSADLDEYPLVTPKV